MELLRARVGELESQYQTKDVWFLLGPPYEDSRYWLGIEHPEEIMEQWQLLVKTCNWDLNKLFAYSLFWLRHGHPFQYLEGLLGMERTNLQKSKLSFHMKSRALVVFSSVIFKIEAADSMGM